ncbi:MAG: protein kinase [Anaerolineae bacterium]|nr:protein kinase [Anaerolineae bacterium]
MIGTRLNERYRLETLIGQGGMGQVYRAHDEQTGETVAVKILSPRPGLHDPQRRFRRELRTLSSLSHPHVVAVRDHGQADGQPFFVMEYVDGGDLRGLIQAQGKGSSHEEILPLALQLCQALSYIHAQGVVHRDLKPENVLVAIEEGREGKPLLKLTDFGLAQLAGPDVRLTQAGEMMGTVLYMAPEQARGQVVDLRADLYAMGIILYEALAGRHPFQGDDPITILVQQIGASPTPLRHFAPLVPKPWEQLVVRLLAKDPADRFASAEEVLVILRGWAGAISTDHLLAPQPARVDLIFQSPLVGREAELFRLRQALEASGQGDGPVVFIQGEAGVGKTRLVQELATVSTAPQGSPGVRLWLGKSYEAERLPYQSFVEILRLCLRRTGPSWPAPYRLQPLLTLLPELGSDPALSTLPVPIALDAEAEKYRLFDAVAFVLVEMAGNRPTVLCLDDVQWADAASLELLAFLSRTLGSAPILLCALYRSEEVPQDHAVLQLQRQLNHQGRAVTLDLEPLDRVSVSWMVGAMFGELAAAERLGGMIYREAKGNPFFVKEIVQSLVEDGLIYRAGGQWQRRTTDRWDVPAGILDLLDHRLSRLGESARRAVTVASAIGREFDFDTLRLAGRFDEDTLLDALDELVRARVLHEDTSHRIERYDFSHDQMRKMAYARLSPSRQRQLHRHVAQALEQIHQADLDPVAGEMARHYERAGDLAQAVTWAERAGQAAATRIALEEALEHYQRALDLERELPPDAERRYRLSALAVGVAHSAGRPEIVDLLSQQMLEMIDRQGPAWESRRWPVLREIAQSYQQRGEPALFEAVCTRLVALSAEDTTRQTFSYLLWGLALKETGRMDEAETRLRHSMALATGMGNQRLTAIARREIGNIHLWRGDLEQARAHQEEALEILRCIPETPASDIAFSALDLAETLYNLGCYAEAAVRQTEALDISRQITYFWLEMSALGELGRTQIKLGQWGAAHTGLRQAIEGNRRLGERLEQVTYALALARVERHLGHAAEARALAVEGLALAQRRQSSLDEARALAELSLVEMGLDHSDAAHAYATEALHAARQAPTPAGIVAARLVSGQLALARGDGQAAAGAAAWVLEQNRGVRPQDQAEALLLRGVVQSDQADLHAAWRVAREAKDQPIAWRAALALASLHRQMGDGDGASEWQRTAEAEIKAVAASFDDPELAQALHSHASRCGPPFSA